MTQAVAFSRDFTDAVIGMEQAADETGIFQALHTACERMLGPTQLAGFVAALNRRSIRRAFCAGMTDLPVEAISAWLADRQNPEPELAGTASLEHPVFFRLHNDGQIIGGVVLRCPQLDSGKQAVRQNLIRLTDSSLRTLQRQKLTQMVLEALEQSEEAISFYDEEDGVVFSNPAYHRVFPHYPGRQGLLGARHLDLYKLDLEAGIIDDPLARTDPDAYLAGRAELASTLVDHHREIQTLGGRTYIYFRMKSRTGATMSRGIDITEQWQITAKLRERERELKELVYRDVLTGLHNRAFLRQHITAVSARLEAGAINGFAVLLIDLNDFKAVNDAYGHDTGDQVLKVLAERIASAGGNGQNTIARLGGDEFVVVLENQTSRMALRSLARQLIASIGNPIESNTRVFRMGCSIGIAIATGDRAGRRDILVDADVAMYHAKSRKPKRSDYAFFRPIMLDELNSRRNLVAALRTAVSEQKFELNYQPRFCTMTRRLIGFEALLRWRNQHNRPVPPSRFIPILEETGLIDQVGEWVLAAACEQARSWPGHLSVAVNVSPVQVGNARFAQKVADILARTGLPAQRLELEITESVFLDNEKAAVERLNEWRALGVRVALDDFGKGYSSFEYLSWVPVDILKIDRSFIARFDPNEPNLRVKEIMRSIIDLGKSLGMLVIAEGVEREDQMELLRSIGCPQVQGYLLGQPMPLSDVLLLLNRTSAPVCSHQAG